MDNISTEKQRELYAKFEEVSGLKLSLISSGGKSIHGHIALDERTEIDKVVYLRRLLCIALDSDPAVTSPHQPVRLPEFYRKEKGNYQSLLQIGARYSYEEIVNGLKGRLIFLVRL